jgi:hypothetical protein
MSKLISDALIYLCLSANITTGSRQSTYTYFTFGFVEPALCALTSTILASSGLVEMAATF